MGFSMYWWTFYTWTYPCVIHRILSVLLTLPHEAWYFFSSGWTPTTNIWSKYVCNQLTLWTGIAGFDRFPEHGPYIPWEACSKQPLNICCLLRISSVPRIRESTLLSHSLQTLPGPKLNKHLSRVFSKFLMVPAFKLHSQLSFAWVYKLLS